MDLSILAALSEILNINSMAAQDAAGTRLVYLLIHPHLIMESFDDQSTIIPLFI